MRSPTCERFAVVLLLLVLSAGVEAATVTVDYSSQCKQALHDYYAPVWPVTACQEKACLLTQADYSRGLCIAGHTLVSDSAMQQVWDLQRRQNSYYSAAGLFPTCPNGGLISAMRLSCAYGTAGEPPPPPPPCEAGTEVNHVSANPPPEYVCDGVCEYVPGNGVNVCLADSCYGIYEQTGGTCSDPNEINAPEGCSVDAGTIVCDCAANPAAPFCPGGQYAEADNCVSNATTGQTTCYNDPTPEDPSDPGTPGNNQNPDDVDGDGNPDVPPDRDGDGIADSDDPDAPVGPGDEVQCTAGVDCEDDLQSAQSSGSCDEPPACSGPAVECATLNQIWRSSCALIDMNGNSPPWVDDPDWGRDLKAERQLVSVEGNIQSEGASGTCPVNPTISVLGQSIVLDISAICGAADIIRMFVLIMAWLSAGYIVYRGF